MLAKRFLLVAAVLALLPFSVVAQKMPKPLWPGQRRAPCKGQQVEILGGCWYDISARVKPPCEEGAYEWEGREDVTPLSSVLNASRSRRAPESLAASQRLRH